MATAPTHLPHLPHPLSHRHAVEALLVAVLAVAAGLLVLAAGLDDSNPATKTVVGSGNVVSQARTLPEFGAIDMAGTNNVTVRVGGPQSVVVRTDDNLLRQVTTNVRQGELVIGETGSLRTSGTMQVAITVPALAVASMSGDGVLAVTGVRADRFSATLAGTGVLRVTGSADWLRARLTGDGDLDLGSLRARHVAAKLQGTGRIFVNATGTLDTSVTGTGTIVRR